VPDTNPPSSTTDVPAIPDTASVCIPAVVAFNKLLPDGAVRVWLAVAVLNAHNYRAARATLPGIASLLGVAPSEIRQHIITLTAWNLIENVQQAGDSTYRVVTP
jgi:hypothetical protein